MCCDKNDTIRVLSMYLTETQAQYNDCLSEAAEQGTLMELQRDAIQQLQNTIVRKDLVYYSLLIKAQELFRGHIQNARAAKSKVDGLVKSKKCLEAKYRKIKCLWREADREWRKIKCISSLCESNTKRELQCKDCSTWTDNVEFSDSQEIQVKVNFLLRENEDLKRQLCGRRIEFEVFDREVKNQMSDNNRTHELDTETNVRLRENEHCLETEKRQLELMLKQHLEYVCVLIAELQYTGERDRLNTDCPNLASCDNMDGPTIKDELNRRNVEIDKLIAEARDKEQELGMLQDMRKEFEKTEGLEKINECLTRELSILRQTAENKGCCCSVGKSQIIQEFQSDKVEDRIHCCEEQPENRDSEMIKQLKDQLSSTRELTEQCHAELRNSKEMLCYLRDKISSLKRLLKEKSDELAILQADHQMIRNDYTILKTENGIFEEKACTEIREFREKLKTLQSELHIVDESYQRVSQDFDKSQELLIEAAKREVELQHAITATEELFGAKLSSADKEGKRLNDLVDMLRCELEKSREEFASREEDFTERCRDGYEQIEILEDRVAMLEETNHQLARQLQESRLQNYSLIEENSRLTDSGCRCVKELQDTHNALLDLKGECKAKSKTLDCVSAELISVATSRTEICDESQNVVSCIRAWMNEQRRLVETLSKKLKGEKNRLAQLAFEKKALVATVRDLMRINGTINEYSTRKKMCSPNRRRSKSSYCQTSPLCCTSRCCTYCRARQNETTSTTTVCTRPLKRRCGCLTRTSKRSMIRGNSWWLPKLERVNKQLCCKSRQRVEKIHDGWQSETSIDEARDFGYQSSASK